ncbi:patched family protein, partial [Ostertagia ostertagi]
MQSISDLKEASVNEFTFLCLLRKDNQMFQLITLFPPRDAQRDSYSIFGSKFASFVLEDVEGNAVSEKSIKSVAALHRSIMSLKTSDGGKVFSDVCLRSSDGCTLHPLAYALEDDEPVLSAQFLLRYPMLTIGDLLIDNALVFGGVVVNESKKDNHGNGPIETAKALRIFYLLEPSIDVERFVDALTETAASLFLTSLTDGLSFSIGSVSDFYAVRVFCTYCAMAILFMFLFQITFFNAVMVLCCRREIAGRHSLFCYRVSQAEKQADDTCATSLSTTLGEILARFVSTKLGKSLIVVLYFIYLTASINFALELPLGLDLKLLTPSGSYLADFLRAEERLFKEYGLYCFAVVRLQNWPLIDPNERRRLLTLYDDLSSSPYASKGEFWLEEFEKLHNGKAFTSHTFNAALLSLSAQKPQYRSDIRFNPDGDIKATKMLMRVRLLGTANEKPRAEVLRKTMSESGFNGFVYDTRFILSFLLGIQSTYSDH